MGRVGQWAELTSSLPIQMIHILGVSHPPPPPYPPLKFLPWIAAGQCDKVRAK